MSQITQKILSALLISFMLAVPVYAEDEDERRKPPTQKTEKLSRDVYEKLAEAQTALEEKNNAGAQAILDALLTKGDALNDYEKAQIYSFYASLHYEAGDLDATIEDYKKIIRLEKVPKQLKDNALFRLAQLFFVQEKYAASIKVLDAWMKKQESVLPDAYILKAQAYFQIENYEGAKEAALAALKEASKRKQKPKENWLALLRAVYYELEDYKSAAKLLEMLIAHYPKPSYYKQLAGMYGLMDQQQKQLQVMHAAYVAGMLESEGEILNMARLYMAEDAPAPAIAVLESAFEKGLVDKEDPENLQLLAQGMSLAQDHESQIPVLTQLAELSGEATHYLYLGQAQIALSRWADAAKSLRSALKQGKDLKDRGNVQIQLGMALFNAGKLREARRVFIDASADAKVGQKASNWVKYVDSEMLRKSAIQGG